MNFIRRCSLRTTGETSEENNSQGIARHVSASRWYKKIISKGTRTGVFLKHRTAKPFPRVSLFPRSGLLACVNTPVCPRYAFPRHNNCNGTRIREKRLEEKRETACGPLAIKLIKRSTVEREEDEEKQDLITRTRASPRTRTFTEEMKHNTGTFSKFPSNRHSRKTENPCELISSQNRTKTEPAIIAFPWKLNFVSFSSSRDRYRALIFQRA